MTKNSIQNNKKFIHIMRYIHIFRLFFFYVFNPLLYIISFMSHGFLRLPGLLKILCRRISIYTINRFSF